MLRTRGILECNMVSSASSNLSLLIVSCVCCQMSRQELAQISGQALASQLQPEGPLALWPSGARLHVM